MNYKKKRDYDVKRRISPKLACTSKYAHNWDVRSKTGTMT
jgi:hypothetical protein